MARTLHALGADVRVIGLAGGVTGAAVRAGLAAAGVPAVFTPIAGETRRTFAVVDTGSHDTALFNEPGPAVTAGEYDAVSRFVRRLAGRLRRGRAVRQPAAGTA